LDKFGTFKQLQKEKRRITFRSLLYQLSDSNVFGEMIMKEHCPGLMEFVNGGSSLTETERNLLPAEITPSFARLKKIQVGYNIMKPFLEPNNELYKMGLMKELKHVRTGTTGTRENGKTRSAAKKNMDRLLLLRSVKADWEGQPLRFVQYVMFIYANTVLKHFIATSI
jgi:hypothetical protein